MPSNKLDPRTMAWMAKCLRASKHTADAATIDSIEDGEQLVTALNDGIILIHLSNAILPNTIRKYNKKKPMSKFKRLENIQKFLKACRYKHELIPAVIFASADLEIGGFGGNGIPAVISTLKHLMEKSGGGGGSSTRCNQPTAAAPKPSLVETLGYPDEEECFYMDDDGEVNDVTLSELKELYNGVNLSAYNRDERLLGSTQVSFGEDWKPLLKWLGPRQDDTNSNVPLWKQKKNTVSAKRKSSVEASTLDPTAEQWYYEDDDHWKKVTAGPFELDQMQDWFEMGKLRHDHLVWYEINGERQMTKTDASLVAQLKQGGGNKTGAAHAPSLKAAHAPPLKKGGRPPPSAPKANAGRAPPRAPPKKSKMAKAKNNEQPDQPYGKEFRRGLLGKFARNHKNKVLNSKNWKKRFFVLHGGVLEYYETRTKFIRRKMRSGRIELERGDVGRATASTSKLRYNFELRRGETCLLKMFADDEMDCQLWVEAIESCVGAL